MAKTKKAWNNDLDFSDPLSFVAFLPIPDGQYMFIWFINSYQKLAIVLCKQ